MDNNASSILLPARQAAPSLAELAAVLVGTPLAIAGLFAVVRFL